MTAKANTATQCQKLLRAREVADRIGLSRSAVYELVKTGDLPRPVSLTPHRVAWPEREIDAFIEKKIAERDAAAA